MKDYHSAVRDLIGYFTRGQAYESDQITLKDELKRTPERFLSAWRDELCSGYDYTEDDIAALLTQFDSENYDQIILLKGIEFSSLCSHHLLPFLGTAHVAYLPDKKVAGISKLARIVDIYSKRLTMQERITVEITNALMKHLKPKGAACVLTAKHTRLSCRGVSKQHSEMITSSVEGVFRDNESVREELWQLIRMK